MHVIQTHEHADFDAIASLLAAHLLNRKAVPVLPRKVNRNVRHFLSLYWESLPFVRPDNLDRRDRIDKVLLVDTQNLASLRGMVSKPEVAVIDHHPRSPHLDPDWDFEGDLIGATTTILVERFSDHGVRPSPIEATLLLAGVYEDTGSLSFNTTSVRDIRCAAWLIDNGANHNLMVRFLHHPLSEAQQQLLDALQESAETYDFKGQSVVVSCAEAKANIDEISTLAHKMRDLYEPDGLFLIVELEHHLQIVARSSTDSIDVGAIATVFGGGGHSRAAAAIVRGKSSQQTKQRLLDLLPDYVRPKVLVSAIMSHGVETLDPATSVDEVANLALRRGHEGFPVAQDGKVIGLVTRRDIDRALQHKLGGAVISRIMRGGDVHVYEDDPVTRVQALMTEHGWGQIPVVNSETGEITGIVTRTDVIELWHPDVDKDEGIMQLGDQMRSILPSPVYRLARKIGAQAQNMNVRAFLVGGLVRDIILGIPNMDLDVVVEGDAITLAKELQSVHGGRVRAHGKFKTAKWLLQDGFWEGFDRQHSDPQPPLTFVDFATARSEFYQHPSALPQVTRSSIKLDLHRRDFTINTLALRLDPARFGELLDFYSGKRDIDGGVVRVLHSLSFIDDPTRILRAIRFEQRLGFNLETRTQELLQESITLLDRVTGDRIRHELEQMLREPYPERGFSRLEELGVLKQIHSSLSFDEWVSVRFKRLRDLFGDPIWLPEVDDYAVELTHYGLLTYRMSASDVMACGKRLRVQRITTERIAQLHEMKGVIHHLASEEKPSRVVRLLEKYPQIVQLMTYVATDDEQIKAVLKRYVVEWSKVRPGISGDVLRNMGVEPGPRMGMILTTLKEAWLDGQVQSEADEKKMLTDLLHQLDSSIEC